MRTGKEKIEDDNTGRRSAQTADPAGSPNRDQKNKEDIEYNDI